MTSLNQPESSVESPIIVGPDDILLELCDSVSCVLSRACHKPVRQAQMVQNIQHTSLKPDISGFVVFEGGFTGLVILNFSADAAMDVYRDYMMSMGMDEAGLAMRYTSDEVSDSVGELMNQVVGDFINRINLRLQSSVEQSQPKVLTSGRQLTISIDAGLQTPITKRVAFYTQNNNTFYLEYAMEDTEFVATKAYIEEAAHDPDSVLANHQAQQATAGGNTAGGGGDDSDALLSELGL
ncbi:MAG: DUF3334 family protein [Cellvibrionaceae bacterium]|nr:DUF3334 family protein [Cellvibrionaceae bacterium]MCV6626892.1 DUF3334 family protein [Cellvibrionaceae bacterium]